MPGILSQLFPPRPKWSVDQIPDLTGKVILVTGGNTGIGKETCKQLLIKGAKVYLGARSVGKAKEAIEDLRQQTGREAIFLQMDLADLASVRRAAEEFLAKEEQLHVLFNNAGVMTPPIENITADGYDLQFGTNVVGHFFLVRLLLPLLIKTYEVTGTPTRIIVTCSSVEKYFSGPIQYDTLVDGPARVKLGKNRLYAQSKFGNVVLATELARRYTDKGVVVIGLDPGNIQSDLQREVSATSKWLMDHTLLHPTPFGALSQLYAGTMPEGEKLSGKYLVPWARLGAPNPKTQNEEEGKKLWNWLDAQIQGK
ncbi:NAD(P)-binding protein [Calocera viscosa TUFC12733]|uniref:NAD(P)-binding protein n=1 Tax=Calocera viscosa (strain TUFC12733) TaxID=1330018 RepID=A0A167HFZ4_CALVF|nr:NAD(P)-binding protein [Calocera viscosa TUFC12733]